jgi:hypothetical protein
VAWMDDDEEAVIARVARAVYNRFTAANDAR